MNTSATVKYIYMLYIYLPAGRSVLKIFRPETEGRGTLVRPRENIFQDKKFSRVPRSRLLTGEILVIGIMFFPYHISAQLSRLAG